MFGMQQVANGMGSSVLGGFGVTPYGGGQASPVSGLDQQQQLLNQNITKMMGMMSSLMDVMFQRQMQGLVSGSTDFGSGATSGGSSAGISDFLGSSSATGSVSGASEAAAGGESGSKAVDIAKKYLGQKSGDIKDLQGFERTGQADNNCAEFVAACLTSAGVYKKKPGDASVRVLKQHLIEDGWKKVSKEQTKPGDVAVFNGNQHIELVAEKGGAQLIGSNNKGGSNVQSVNQGSGDWGSKEYYSKG